MTIYKNHSERDWLMLPSLRRPEDARSHSAGTVSKTLTFYSAAKIERPRSQPLKRVPAPVVFSLVSDWRRVTNQAPRFSPLLPCRAWPRAAFRSQYTERARGKIKEKAMLILILLVFALACFVLNAIPQSVGSVNFDAAGKAFLVGALIAHLY